MLHLACCTSLCAVYGIRAWSVLPCVGAGFRAWALWARGALILSVVTLGARVVADPLAGLSGADPLAGFIGGLLILSLGLLAGGLLILSLGFLAGWGAVAWRLAPGFLVLLLAVGTRMLCALLPLCGRGMLAWRSPPSWRLGHTCLVLHSLTPLALSPGCGAGIGAAGQV